MVSIHLVIAKVYLDLGYGSKPKRCNLQVCSSLPKLIRHFNYVKSPNIDVEIDVEDPHSVLQFSEPDHQFSTGVSKKKIQTHPKSSSGQKLNLIRLKMAEDLIDC